MPRRAPAKRAAAWHAPRRVRDRLDRVRRPGARRRSGALSAEERGDPARISRPRSAAIGFAGGFLGSLLGVGGGFVMVPLQVMWARVSQHAANGTSLAAIAPLTLVGAAVYALASDRAVDWRLVLPLAVGSVIGAPFGARWAARLPERTLRRVVAAVIALAGVKQLVLPG